MFKIKKRGHAVRLRELAAKAGSFTQGKIWIAVGVTVTVIGYAVVQLDRMGIFTVIWGGR